MKCQICGAIGSTAILEPHTELSLTGKPNTIIVCQLCHADIHRADRRREQEKLGIEKFLKGRQK